MGTSRKKTVKSEMQLQREQWRRAAAEIIAATRRDKDISQVQFGDNMGWSHDTVANVESGRRKIEFGDVVMSAIALGESPDTLIRRILQWNNKAR